VRTEYDSAYGKNGNVARPTRPKSSRACRDRQGCAGRTSEPQMRKAKLGSIPSPLRFFPMQTTVFAGSNTHSKGTPPQMSECSAQVPNQVLYVCVLHHTDARSSRNTSGEKQKRSKKMDPRARPIHKLCRGRHARSPVFKPFGCRTPPQNKFGSPSNKNIRAAFEGQSRSAPSRASVNRTCGESQKRTLQCI